MRVLKTCALALGLLVILAVPAWTQTEIKIRVEHANAREAPSPQADVVKVLNRGEVYSVVDDVPYWYGVALGPGQKAYVAKSLCTLVVESGETESGDASNESLGELYTLPAPGNTFSLPNCTPIGVPTDWDVCPAEGSGGANRLANMQKNRSRVVCDYTVMTFDQVLDLNNLPKNVRNLAASDSRATYLGQMEARPVVLEAYLAMVKSGGAESPNCNSAERKDVHMELAGNDSEDPKQTRDKGVVAEVTPWFGAQFPSWTLDSLGQYSSYKSGYGGNMKRPPTKVRIYGWLFFDNWHAADGSVRTWRGTAWEIHPITRIEVWENGAWKQLR